MHGMYICMSNNITCTHILHYPWHTVVSVTVGEVPEGELLEGAGLQLTSKSALSS